MGTDWLSLVEAWASAWPAGLWRASWQGALCAALAWALTRTWPRLPASLRAGLWWLVALKFVVSLGWMKPVPLPVLPASLVALAPRADAMKEGREAPVEGIVREAPRGAAPPPVITRVPREHAAPSTTTVRSVPWGRVLAWMLFTAWAAGVLWQLRSHVKGWGSMRRLRRSARPLLHPVLESEVRRLSAAAKLRRAPRLLVSESVASPLATGLLDPVVVLPAKAVRRLPVEALRMALAHELAHLRRGDLWLGWVPALAEALLFFHPLARRAAREYALAREEACDAEALHLTGAEPADYGELLIAFGVTRGAGTAAALGASAHVYALHRRLSMLEHVDAVPAPSRRLLKAALTALGLAALVPFQVVAQESAAKSGAPATPAPAATGSASKATPSSAPTASAKPGLAMPPPVPAAPAKPGLAVPPPVPAVPAKPGLAVPPPVPPAPMPARLAGIPAVPPVPPAPRVAAVAPVPPIPPAPRVAAVAPVPPVPPVPPRIADGDDDNSYVLLADNMAMMNGSSVDLNLAGMFKQPGKELLYVRRKGEAFIIRDTATLKAVRAALEPTRDMGKAQGDLGGKQGELGGKQGELGAKQGELGMKQAELGMKQAELAHKQAGLSLEEMRLHSLPEAERERRQAELRKQDQALEQEMRALEKQLAALEEQQEALNREQEKLGEQQEALGREQEKLGEQQEALSREADEKVRGLIDEALRKGLGQPLPT